jgi:CheY-like chemotaxis protein
MNKTQQVLIVDDDTFLLEMYNKKFEKAGITAEIIADPKLALEKLRNGFEPDIILLDVIMPGIDGMELLQTIREEKLVPNATIIMLTNESSGAVIEKAKSLGIKGYIVKATTIPSEVVEEVIKIAGINMEGKND